MFYGEFTCATDVFNEFHVDSNDRAGKIIIFAAYDYADYEGYAQVVFIENGKIYAISGSHCSCHGLEDQWDPDEMPLAAIRKISIDGNLFNEGSEELTTLLDRLEYNGAFEMEPLELQMFLTLTY